ncbi:MAG: CBS domain-containing protein [Saprospiraceae bacterium]|nr:CBS domain-containing protein [Saprospiraceae bacterium]MBK6566446.1 CBS domain-containing protein [Saprospiraceae bacterium]MBK7524377.1 CBS domain-containing protein [Saprospiraceae bacterium]MBK8549166.1 CBS domain-containing protein [Saprospiraceae bacterium]MBK8852560.1 CBS domain-containing protein [Saprospiraceae bacterium]
MTQQEMLKIPVRLIMTTDLFVANKDTILKEINIIVERENIHHIPVVDNDNKFVGMISKSDILLLMDWGTKKNLPGSERKNVFMLTSNLAVDLMETSVVQVSPEDTVEKCVQIFKENYFHALPVVNESGVLVGLVTTFDLLMLAYTPQFALNMS